MAGKSQIELSPQGNPGSGSYFIYTRRNHGLWTSINMGIFYAILIGVAIWGQEYILLGLTVLLVIWLVYDQWTNPQFLEIDQEAIRFLLPRKVQGEVSRSTIESVDLSPEQIRIKLLDGELVVLEINALLSKKKRTELRQFVRDQFQAVHEVEH